MRFFSLDLLTGWDLAADEDRKKAWTGPKAKEPPLVVVSPLRAMLSIMQNTNRKFMRSPRRQKLMAAAIRMLPFAMEIAG